MTTDPAVTATPGDDDANPANAAADRLFRHESARLRASLARTLGTARLDLVEDVVQDALVAALHHWRFAGIPENPGAWLTRVAQRRAIDLIRRGHAESRALTHWLARQEGTPDRDLDDELAMLLACASPALPESCRVPLMLHHVAGFSAAEIAHAFLISNDAAAQRLVRGKQILRDNAVSIEVPEAEALHERLSPTLDAIYLMLTEGHSASPGQPHIREDLLAECERLLTIITTDHRTASPAAHALMALVLFTRSRSPARLSDTSAITLLSEQDRALWDRRRINRAMLHLARAAGGTALTRYHLEAGIAAVHATAETFDATDWRQILELYNALQTVHPTPVVAVNRAAARAMIDGPAAALADLDAAARTLDGYLMYWATRAELLTRLDRPSDAAAALRCALACSPNDAESALLTQRLARAQAAAEELRPRPSPRDPKRESPPPSSP